MEEYRRIRAALVGHSDQVFDLLAKQLAYLGSKEEWSVDDNLYTTREAGSTRRGDRSASRGRPGRVLSGVLPSRVGLRRSVRG